MAKSTVNVRIYYVLPCCMLLLHLVNALVEYQAQRIPEPVLRTTFVMGMVLVGSSMVAFLISPRLEQFVRWLQRTSRAQAGGLGEGIFLLVLGAVVFWLFHRMVNYGIESLLPVEWRVL